MHVSAPLSVCHITGSVCCSLLIPHKSFSWGIFRDGCYVSGTCHVISTRIGRGRNLGEGKEVRRAPSPTFLSLCFLIHWSAVFEPFQLCTIFYFLFFFPLFWHKCSAFVVFPSLTPVLFEVNLWTHTFAHMLVLCFNKEGLVADQKAGWVWSCF